MATRRATPTTKEGLVPLAKRNAWKALQTQYRKVRDLHLRSLFAGDPGRGERMTAEAVGLFLDYSKNRITDRTLKLLIRLAEESGLRLHIEAMFSGEKINVTEKGAVLHVALRAPEGTSIFVDGENVVPQVHAVLKELASLANRVRSGEWKGYRQAHSQHHQHPHRRLLERRNQLGEVAETVAYDKALLNVIAAIATKSS